MFVQSRPNVESMSGGLIIKVVAGTLSGAPDTANRVACPGGTDHPVYPTPGVVFLQGRGVRGVQKARVPISAYRHIGMYCSVPSLRLAEAGGTWRGAT